MKQTNYETYQKFYVLSKQLLINLSCSLGNFIRHLFKAVKI